MSADFGYINARIRGMKTRLLEPSFFQEALAGEGFRGLVQSLALSSYGSELETAQAAYPDAPLRAVDEAVGRNFHHTTRSLLTFSSGPAREQIALLLMRYDVQNLKAIARAKHAGRSLDDIARRSSRRVNSSPHCSSTSPPPPICRPRLKPWPPPGTRWHRPLAKR